MILDSTSGYHLVPIGDLVTCIIGERDGIYVGCDDGCLVGGVVGCDEGRFDGYIAMRDEYKRV